MYDVFLCHNGADKAWVEELAAQLEGELIGGRPLRVFFDKWDIDYGDHILERIEQGLNQARFLAIILSPAAAKAPWPRAEWQSQAFDDPLNRRGRLLPILRHKFDPETGEPVEIPLLLKPLRYFDFTTDQTARAEYPRLLARLRGERPPRGPRGPAGLPGPAAGSETPDAVRESVVSNLLPVEQHPPWLYSDLTTATRQKEVWSMVRGRTPPFVLHAGRLYTFADLSASASPFQPVLSGMNVRRERTVDVLEDPDRARLVTWLYNDALREHCFQLRIRTPKRAGRARAARERFQFFCPTFDGQPRTFAWREGARPRTLAKVVTQKDGSTLGVHYAARMRFITLGNDLYLLIDPGWMFTEDGVTPLTGPQVGVFSTKWGGRERNAAVLRNVLMWAILLGQGDAIEIDCGGATKLRVAQVPAHAETPAGIAGDLLALDRMLGGEGAGEVALDTDAEPVAGSAAFVGRGNAEDIAERPEDELDQIAQSQALGLFDPRPRNEDAGDGDDGWVHAEESELAGFGEGPSAAQDEERHPHASAELPF